MWEAFLNAIEENPDDLGCWNAFADWLIEQGDPRGEFMAIQLDIEQNRDHYLQSDPAKLDHLVRRRRELFQRHRRDFLGDLADVLQGDPDWLHSHSRSPFPSNYTFRRGWLDAMQSQSVTERFLQMMAKVPQSRLLRVWSVNWWLDRDAETDRSFVNAIREMWTARRRSQAARALLAGCPFLGNIRMLRLSKWRLHKSECVLECFFSSLRRLEQCELIGDGTFVPAVFSNPLPWLRYLSVSHFGHQAIVTLAANPTLKKRLLRL